MLSRRFWNPFTWRRSRQPESADSHGWCKATVEFLSVYRTAIEEGRIGDADLAFVELASYLARNYSPDGAELITPSEAERCESECDWNGAEAARRIEVENAVQAHPMDRSRALAALSRLYHLLGKHELALEMARAATESIRPVKTPMGVSMALERQAISALKCDDLTGARAAIDEALGVLKGDDKLYDGQRGKCLVVLANCRFNSSDVVGAESDLEKAWEELEPYVASELATGLFPVFARWWSVRGKIDTHHGNLADAADDFAKAVEWHRKVIAVEETTGPYIRNALAGALSNYGRALCAAGNPYDAWEAFAESRTIREQLGLPPLSENS
jgi:hypothetical protein